MEIAQERKAVILEQTVINKSAEELSKIYDELGYVEMSAPALGLACRYRGIEIVKVLIEKGASFDFPSTREIEEKYHCYIGYNYDNYRTNYSLYLLKAFRGGLKGACCLKGMTLNKNAKRETGKPLPFLADDERVIVLNYLFENKEKISFQPEEMLFYAIYAKDTVIVEKLRKFGVKLSEMRIQIITEGGMAMDGYWFEYGAMTGKLADEDYLEVMEQLALELDGEPFYLTEKTFALTKKRFSDIKIFEFFLAHFRQDKMNKNKIIRSLIDEDALDALPAIEKEGWLNVPKKRDEMIEYASQNNKTESLAWLLDFKNRTADFAAEQKMAEKKMMRELNASPDSVSELKKIWSYKKREDGTLVITNYKGTNIEVVVPEKIGRSIVTAIGQGAFTGSSGIGVITYATLEQEQHHRKITKITLPNTIQYIGKGAFSRMSALKEIIIPEGVREIASYAFYGCSSLEKLTIPETVNIIGEYAFENCNFFKLIIYCAKESNAESYCKENGYQFKNSED